MTSSSVNLMKKEQLSHQKRDITIPIFPPSPRLVSLFFMEMTILSALSFAGNCFKCYSKTFTQKERKCISNIKCTKIKSLN